jgi:alkylation response protein AidB-like acyl-CoA dehydrogenase
MYDDPRGTTDNMWQDLVGLGLTGILVPEDCGGLGLGLSDMGVVLEEMGRALHPGPFLSSAVAATLAVRASGSGLDQSAVLTGLASGEQLATLALFEPAQRYEWRTPITSARQGLDGRWTVTGTKVHVPDAAAADLLLISAKAPDGLGLFVVEASTASIQPDVVLDGTRKQATVVLNESPATRLGQGDLTSALAGMVDRVAVAYVVDAVGAGAAALEMCVSYAKDRVAFGRPIGSFQAVQHLCVAMYEKLELSRAAAYRGLWSDDAGEDELHRVALIAKTYASDALVALANDAIQIHGGIGTTWEHNIHLFYKRCVSMQAAYGSSLEHADALATFLID